MIIPGSPFKIQQDGDKIRKGRERLQEGKKEEDRGIDERRNKKMGIRNKIEELMRGERRNQRQEKGIRSTQTVRNCKRYYD